MMYSLIIGYFPDLSLSLYPERKQIAQIIAAFSFTMLGFLAALIGIMFTNTASRSFTKYRKSGSLTVFLCVYFGALVFLMLDFIFAILSLSDAAPAFFMRISIAMTIGSFLHILTIAAAVLFSTINSSHESERAIS